MFFEAHFFYTKEGWNEAYLFLLKKYQRRKDNCAVNKKRSLEDRAVARCGILI
jgi:hypothetical protein